MDQIISNIQPLLSYFYKWESECPEKAFLKQPYGKDWKTITYREAGDQARRIANALLTKEYPKGSNIAILSKNCYHWIITDLAIQMAGHVSVPLYPNLEPEQLNLVLKKSDAKLLFVGKLEAWYSEAIPSDVEIIRFPHYEGNSVVEQGEAWEDLLEGNKPLSGQPLPDLDDLWTILFTSGTTGTPKGVMHLHRNPAIILANEAKNHDLGIFKFPVHRFLSFLPLNHVAERIGIEAACLLVGGVIHFGESLDTFPSNLQDTQPTLFIAVPRIWAKFQSAVYQRLSPKRFKLLMNTPLVGSYLRKKLRKGFGLSQANVVLTGSAPTPDHLKGWYASLGIQLREVYGLTETCGAMTVTPMGDPGSSSVGKPVTNAEVKTDPETGELLVKTPWMTQGYYREPEKTKELFREGWLCTGDKARIDDKGNIFIIGRISEPFKTAKGKFVIPTPLEEVLLESPFLEQVCIAGRGLPQPLALAVLSEIAKEKGEQEVLGNLEKVLDGLNGNLPNFKKVSTLVIVQEEWSVENKILTPTLKVKRNLVNEKYESQYLGWHEAPGKVIKEGEGKANKGGSS